MKDTFQLINNNEKEIYTHFINVLNYIKFFII